MLIIFFKKSVPRSMKAFLIIGLALCWVLASTPAHAKIYKWKDENGKTHFTNDPTKVPKAENTEVETSQELMASPASVAKPDLPQINEEPSAEKEEEGSLEDIYKKFKIEKPDKKQSSEREQESTQKLLQKAEASRERQLKKLKEIENLDHKPESWTNEGSLEEIADGLKKGVEKSDQEIKRYKERLNPTAPEN